jgi:tetratricopeptide (TPR) repeat protein
LERSSQAYELWAKSYPQDAVPHNNLGFIYSELGQYEKALTETQESQHLEPNLIGYTNLASIYLAWIIHEVSSQKRKDALKG